MMKVKICLSLLLISGFLVSLAENTKGQRLLSKTVESFKSHKSVDFDVRFKFKFFDYDDTNSFKGQCKIIRMVSDTVFGAYIWLKPTDSVEQYYDGMRILDVDHTQKKVTEYPEPAKQKWAIAGNVTGDMYKVYFTKPDKLSDVIKDSVRTTLSDTVISGKKFSMITIFHPDEEEFKGNIHRFWFGGEDSLLAGISWQIRFQNQIQYAEWQISDLIFDRSTEKSLADLFESTTRGYSIEAYQEKTGAELKMLEAGDTAPDFKATLYPDNKVISLSELRGRPVLIDFWYMGCYPCIKAIPHLSEIDSLYRDKGLAVIGLDHVDNNEKGIRRLPDFISINKLSYQIAFIEEEVPKLYRVQAYPSLYLIDKNGRIAHSLKGYNENMSENLKAEIMKVINN